MLLVVSLVAHRRNYVVDVEPKNLVVDIDGLLFDRFEVTGKAWL